MPTLDQLQKVGDFLQGSAATLLLFGGLFALKRHREAKRLESIRWLNEAGSRFYQFDKIDEQTRREFEYDFATVFSPVMEKWLVYPGRLTEADKRVLTRIDALLNFFELVCHVSDKDRYLSRSDREATFQYWFDDIIGHSRDHRFLQLYVSFGFENLRNRVGFQNPVNRIAVYGSLLQPPGSTPPSAETNNPAAQARESLGKFVGKCRIRGKLVDLGDYPGLLPDDSASTLGELYELPWGSLNDPAMEEFRRAMAVLDKYEEYDVSNPANSEFHRRYVALEEPKGTAAWVYFLNPSSHESPLVPSGDWRSHLNARSATPPAANPVGGD